jgi:hypothetical protein
MLVAADNQLAATRKSAGKEFVVITIITDLFRQRLRGEELPFVGCKVNERLQINERKLFSQGFSNSLVFSNYLLGNNQTKFAIAPRLENSIGRP